MVMFCSSKQEAWIWFFYCRKKGRHGYVGLGEEGEFTEVASGGQRVRICSQEIFHPSEQNLTCVIPKEGKEEKAKGNSGSVCG